MSYAQLTLFGGFAERSPRPARRWPTEPPPAPPPAAPPGFDPDAVGEADLAVLRTAAPDHPSGYEGVHPRPCPTGRLGGGGWVGKAFKRPCGPVRKTPREAARDLAAWWRREYGPGWAGFWRLRKARGYKLLRDGGGVRVMVFVRGRPEYVGRGQRGTLFADAAAAVAGYRAWVRERFGAFAGAAGLVLRRTSQVPRRG